MDHDSYTDSDKKRTSSSQCSNHKVLVGFLFLKQYSSATFWKERIKSALNGRNPVPWPKDHSKVTSNVFSLQPEFECNSLLDILTSLNFDLEQLLPLPEKSSVCLQPAQSIADSSSLDFSVKWNHVVHGLQEEKYNQNFQLYFNTQPISAWRGSSLLSLQYLHPLWVVKSVVLPGE